MSIQVDNSLLHFASFVGQINKTFLKNPGKKIIQKNEADDWSAALAATAGPGPRSTLGACQAPQHAQGLALFETFFHPPS